MTFIKEVELLEEVVVAVDEDAAVAGFVEVLLPPAKK